MDSENLNRWLALIANAGVVVGLVFLIIEIRQNTELMRAQMAQSRVDNRLSLYQDQIHSDYWPTIVAKRFDSESTTEWIESLTREEYFRVRSQVLYEINDLRTQFLQYQNGYLDETLFETSGRDQARRLMAQLNSFPDIDISSDEFIEFLNSVASEYDLPTYSRSQ